MERIVKTYEECFWVVQKPLNYRQSCTEAATGDGLITFAKFTGKNLSQSFFFNKVAGLRLATILKERLWYRCFPINFTKKKHPFWKTCGNDCFWLQAGEPRINWTAENCYFYLVVFTLTSLKLQWNLPIADMSWIMDKVFRPKCDNLSIISQQRTPLNNGKSF